MQYRQRNTDIDSDELVKPNNIMSVVYPSSYSHCPPSMPLYRHSILPPIEFGLIATAESIASSVVLQGDVCQEPLETEEH